MGFFRDTFLLLKMELKLEFKHPALLVSMLVFALLFEVILQIAFNADIKSMMGLASGVLWLPIFLSSMLSFTKYGANEWTNRADIGILASPIDAGSVFLARMLGNYLFTMIVAIVSTLSFFLFLKLGIPESTGLLVLVLFAGGWGFTAVGVFLSVFSRVSNMSDLLLPVMLFPLAVPIILAVVQLTDMALFPVVAETKSLWLLMLFGYDVVFTLIPLFLFELLQEV